MARNNGSGNEGKRSGKPAPALPNWRGPLLGVMVCAACLAAILRIPATYSWFVVSGGHQMRIYLEYAGEKAEDTAPGSALMPDAFGAEVGGGPPSTGPAPPAMSALPPESQGSISCTVPDGSQPGTDSSMPDNREPAVMPPSPSAGPAGGPFPARDGGQPDSGHPQKQTEGETEPTTGNVPPGASAPEYSGYMEGL